MTHTPNSDGGVPSIKDLIARATPGPWKVEYDNADERGGGQWYQVGPAKIWWPYATAMGCDERPEAEANAQLIARCSPDTMAAVVERVERIAWGWSENPREDAYEVLALLNGNATAPAQGGGR